MQMAIKWQSPAFGPSWATEVPSGKYSLFILTGLHETMRFVHLKPLEIWAALPLVQWYIVQMAIKCQSTAFGLHNYMKDDSMPNVHFKAKHPKKFGQHFP